ncbi:MAG: penicillin acylase family protein [Opitutaceae bacterium]
MNPAAAKRFRLLASVVSVLVLLAVLAGGGFYFRLRDSLPQLDGAFALQGLGAAVTVDRDSLGVPTVRGANRTDVARALGWIHAQERFFQMDLLRRRGAGELAELFGETALSLDKATRIHGFRSLAQAVMAQISPEQRAYVDAYTAGINAGLAALKAPPFEYLVLRDKPQPWRSEDCVLVGCVMMLDLQGGDGAYERSLLTLRDQLGQEGVAFFAPLLTPNDAALDNSSAPLPPIPSASMLDLRRQENTTSSSPPRRKDAAHPGSNSLALAGSHTANGAGLVANDMHLTLGLPNTWYRASLEWPGHKISGVTLPGVPAVIAGSNGRVAWGFTNANIDTSDLVVIDMIGGSSRLYTVPNQADAQSLETRKTVIRVKGKASVEMAYQWSIWGPIVAKDGSDRPLALRWTAHDPASLNFGLAELEDAQNVREAVAVAHRAGIPTQNFVVADSGGEIAWTIAGRVPKRVGFDGRLPVSWAFGDRRWEGLVGVDEIPVEISPNSGRIWTANQRMLGGAALAMFGDGAYDRPARAAQIRDRLAGLEKASPRDLLAIQLDDRALFLERWQKLLVGTLTPAAIAQKKSRAKLREFAAKWDGRASADSVSYRLVRSFRRAVAARTLTPIFASCAEANPEFTWSKFRYEDALWALVNEKPPHLLSGVYQDWNVLLLAAADDVTAELAEEHVPVDRATWGRQNPLEIRHPFSYSLPRFLTGWLNAPTTPMAGGHDMPLVQVRDFGASDRFVVSPGHEAEGIFQMPGGQSGHPLSLHYLAGHDSWVRGDPAPFLPGKTEHTLTFSP